MKGIKVVLFGVIGITMSSIAFWIVLLFLEPEEGLVALLAAALLAFSVAAYTVVRYIKKGDPHNEGLAACLTSVFSSIVFFVLAFFIVAGNMLLYDVEQSLTEKTELTVEQKVSYYQELITGHKGALDLAELEKTRKSGITFYYEKGADPSAAIDQIIASIEANKPSIEKNLGGKTDAEVSIVLYNDSLTMPVRESINNAYTGFYQEFDQTIHLPMPIEKNTVIHEYVHHLFLNIAREQGINRFEIPNWFNEGVATYLSEKEESLSRSLMQDTEYIEFQYLETHGQWENHLPEPYSPYFQSGSFLQYLVSREGDDVISKIFLEMQDSSFQESFEKVTGKTMEAYEAAFFAEVQTILKLWDKADLMERKEKDYEKSLELFLEIAATAPNLELVNHRIANLYTEAGEYEQAIIYRKKELELAKAEERENLADSYGYLAESQLFIDIPEALKTAKLAVEASTEEGRYWNEGILSEIAVLESHIENGHPLKGYLELLNGRFTINKGVENQGQKIALIDQALGSYAEGERVERGALIELKQSLEKQLIGKY
ncbi:hypothetical protein B0H99_11069 [Planomicrobium soli]|uniref:Uncharacterized protein n=1 Tax=Planomicrobium soli TaxID=1176648 RepID=A0A2P8GG69_9BACL|nr:tetratricopeptide repeat protein [Planomicrobium soli]PSL32959.1 hypothetical protein B0H99_11069 [Planomicrobium soli]